MATKKKKIKEEESISQSQILQEIADEYNSQQGLEDADQYKAKHIREFLDACNAVYYRRAGNTRGVKLYGIGILKKKYRPSRMARNPQTGEQVKTKAKWGVKIRPSKACKDAIL